MKGSQESVQLVFFGDAVKGGTMDVRYLGPALLSFGQLLDRANVVLNGDRAEVSVRIRANLHKSSFEIDFDLVQNIAQRWFEQGKVLTPRPTCQFPY